MGKPGNKKNAESARTNPGAAGAANQATLNQTTISLDVGVPDGGHPGGSNLWYGSNNERAIGKHKDSRAQIEYDLFGPEAVYSSHSLNNLLQM